MEIANNNPFIMQQFAARDAVRQKNGRQPEEFGDVIKSAQESGEQEKADAARREDGQETDYRQFLLEKMEEMRARIKNGDIQPKIQIGAEAYTQEEWKKLLEKVDAAEDAIREQIEEEIAAAKEAAGKDEADSDTKIITRADGAKILMVTTPFGEMSVELSKPDDSLTFDDISRICDEPETAENLDKTVDNTDPVVV
ncbi:MAG: hypothetical protein HFI59_10700 [Lachnospiraceae bacterium]|nr:hypothetical protein [Lachnospiraceae bacterium]